MVLRPLFGLSVAPQVERENVVRALERFFVWQPHGRTPGEPVYQEKGGSVRADFADPIVDASLAKKRLLHVRIISHAILSG